MSRRIEIELTSTRPDGSWTWRAAGAREPKGVLEGALLYSGAKPGDVLKAEADFELEGITILSVIAPKTDGRAEAQRIEIIGPGRPEGPGVTTQLVGRSERRPSDRRRDRDDSFGPRRERTPGRPQTGRETGRPAREGSPADASSAGAPPRRDRPARSDRPARGDGPDRPARSDRPARTPGRDGERTSRTGSSPAEARTGRDRRPGRPAAESGAQTAEAERAKAHRLNPGNRHRKAVMDSLAPEEQPIAEQILRGGIPAVRTALHLEREKAVAEGRAAPNTDELVAMAEALQPKLKAAEWRDRAEAAAADADGISLRDLRSVVAGADAARDDETRALGANLREALERRVKGMQDEWTADIVKQLDENRLVRAIRLSARPPDASGHLDPELAKRLVEAAGQAMSPETASERWAALLDAVAASPIRRSVQPAGLPGDATPDLKRAAHQQSGSIPALAKLLGVAIPPPPVPVAGRHRSPDPTGPATRRKRPPRPTSGPAPRASVPAPPAEVTAPTAEVEPAAAVEVEPAATVEVEPAPAAEVEASAPAADPAAPPVEVDPAEPVLVAEEPARDDAGPEPSSDEETAPGAETEGSPAELS